MSLLERVKATVKRHRMLTGGDHVLTGLSGGPDSVCLAITLFKLKEDLKLALSAVYIDHGLRPGETDNEAEFCEKLCDKLGIAFYKKNVDVTGLSSGRNLQEAARELRYSTYNELAGSINASRIALGHNADDQAETVVMRLLRGSGRKGLTGIPPVRGSIIRPLISEERSGIELFLKENASLVSGRGTSLYVVDSSNLSDKYFRNWIRSNVMERVREHNPSVVQDICRTAEILKEEEDYFEIVVTKTLMRLISRKGDNYIELFLSPLGTIEKPVLRRVLRRAIDATEGLRGIGLVHIDDIINLVRKGKSGDSINLPKDIRVIKDYSILKITTEHQAIISGYIINPPGEINIEETATTIMGIIEDEVSRDEADRSTVILDADRVNFPLHIRSRAEGDFFYPLGFGKRKKIQDFFVDEKVSRDQRDSIPIVLSGNDIIWVAGFRADERFKVTEKTERYLKLTIKKQ